MALTPSDLLRISAESSRDPLVLQLGYELGDNGSLVLGLAGVEPAALEADAHPPFLIFDPIYRDATRPDQNFLIFAGTFSRTYEDYRLTAGNDVRGSIVAKQHPSYDNLWSFDIKFDVLGIALPAITSTENDGSVVNLPSEATFSETYTGALDTLGGESNFIFISGTFLTRLGLSGTTAGPFPFCGRQYRRPG